MNITISDLNQLQILIFNTPKKEKNKFNTRNELSKQEINEEKRLPE